MKILIIEDEIPAVKTLKRLLMDIPELEAEVVGIIDSVEGAVEWFKNNLMPELIFMDIHLTDGISFEILNKVDVTCPIIFTTAYDQYAVDAFKHNSIDYLLKPYQIKDLERAVNKMLNLTSIQLEGYLNSVGISTKKRFAGSFLIMLSDRFLILNTEDIAYFYTTNERTVAYTYDGEEHEIDRSLESIADSLNPKEFIRANRQFVIARRAIRDVDFWFGSRLSVNLTVKIPERIVISKLKTAKFKDWLVEN